MPLTPGERAAHALRVKAPALARSAVDALYRLRPDLESRYGETGRRHCARDVTHHLRFLAAAVELGDAAVFADYAAWAHRVMVTHRVAADDARASFGCLLEVVPAAVAPEHAPAVLEMLNRALDALDSPSAAPRALPRVREPRASCVEKK